MSALEITVNGNSHHLEGPATAADLLEQLELDPRTVVVELNRRIIRRSLLAETQLANGDVVELVHFVGGG